MAKILALGMFRPGFVAKRPERNAQRKAGWKAENGATRRADPRLMLDDGWSCKRDEQSQDMDGDAPLGLMRMALFGCKGLMRTTTAAGEWIERTGGINSTRSAIVKLRKRLCLEYRLKGLAAHTRPRQTRGVSPPPFVPLRAGMSASIFLAARQPPSRAAALRLRRMEPWRECYPYGRGIQRPKDHIHPKGQTVFHRCAIAMGCTSAPASSANGVM